MVSTVQLFIFGSDTFPMIERSHVWQIGSGQCGGTIISLPDDGGSLLPPGQPYSTSSSAPRFTR
jgi:hypothetical protein